MKHIYLLAICLLLSASYAHDAGATEEEVDDHDVFVLTKDNFDQHLADNEFVFVEFYAPWCGHCKRLAPDWGKLATKAKEAGHKVSIAKLDATQAEEVAVKQGVRGYPTIKFYRNGTPLDYEGGRTLDELYKYAVRKSGPASRILNTVEEVEAFLAQAGTKLLSYLSPDSDAHKSWLESAGSGSLEDFSIAHVVDKALYGEHSENSFHIHKDDGEKLPHSGEFNKENIIKFAQSEGHPLVDDLAQKIWQRSQSTASPLFAGFVEEGNQEHKDLIKNLAKKFKGKVLFSSSSQGSLAERWGSSGKVFPTAILVQWVGSDPKMVVFDEEAGKFTAETGEAFINDALEGKYKSYRKSEPVPEKNNGPVKTLVGKNYDELVKNSNKDVFVEFYAPWCGHCKKLSPIWDELGELFEDEESIVIAKMDATANAPPEDVDLRGFPTLLFFPADNKATPISYDGGRDLDSLVKFVKEKASHSVKGTSHDDKVEL